MSWSVSKVGRAAAVAKEVKADLARIKCIEPEESVKSLVGVAIATALEAYPPAFPVKVDANGSMWSSEGIKLNRLYVLVEPLHGFVE